MPGSYRTQSDPCHKIISDDNIKVLVSYFNPTLPIAWPYWLYKDDLYRKTVYSSTSHLVDLIYEQTYFLSIKYIS